MRSLFLLLAALSLSAAPEPPPERKCTLRLAWWATPAERVELAVVQGKEIVPFVALEMNLDLAKDYRGAAQLQIVRRKGEAVKVEPFDAEKLYAQGLATPKPDAKGDPKAKPEPTKKEKADDWAPFASVGLPETSDVGVLLLMGPNGTCAGRAFDYEAGRFPYGSIRVVNLSPIALSGEIDKKPFKINPGSADLLPILFRERTTSHITLDAHLADNGVEHILGTKIAGRPNRRSLVFVMQTGVSTDNRPIFESRSIESVEPVIPETPATPGKAKAK
jgi:hypothetical protein